MTICRLRRAFRDEAEQGGIARDADDVGVDLVIGHGVARLRAAGQRAGAEPDHGHVDRPAAFLLAPPRSPARCPRRRRIRTSFGTAGQQLAVRSRMRWAPCAVVPCQSVRKRPSVPRHVEHAEEIAHPKCAGAVVGTDWARSSIATMAANGSGVAPEQQGQARAGSRASRRRSRFRPARMSNSPSPISSERDDRAETAAHTAARVFRQREARPAQQRQHDQDRIFDDPLNTCGATSPVRMPPIMPPNEIHM